MSPIPTEPPSNATMSFTELCKDVWGFFVKDWNDFAWWTVLLVVVVCHYFKMIRDFVEGYIWTAIKSLIIKLRRTLK